MSKNSKSSLERLREEARLARAVRRSVGMKVALPSLRSMLRACGVYANVIAAVVALGLPTAGSLRSVAGSAALAFESAVRSARESTSGLPDLLTNPADLTEVTEVAAVTEIADGFEVMEANEHVSPAVVNPSEERLEESAPTSPSSVTTRSGIEASTEPALDSEPSN